MAKLHLLVDGIFVADKRIFLPEARRGKYNGAAKSLLIESGKDKILIDTGIGEVPKGKQYDALRKTVTIRRSKSQGTKRQLARLGIAPEQITAVVNTHLHNAHSGCNNLFPDAQFYISKEEFRYIDKLLGDDPNQTAYIRENFENLHNLNQTQGSYKITDEVQVLATPGHTLGHQSVVVAMDGYNLVYSGDVAPLKRNLVEKTPMSGYDREQILESMGRLLKIPSAKWIFSHDNKQLSLSKAFSPHEGRR